MLGENFSVHCMENPVSGLESVRGKVSRKIREHKKFNAELSCRVILLVAGKIVWSGPLPVLDLLSLSLLLQLWVPHPSQHPLHTA